MGVLTYERSMRTLAFGSIADGQRRFMVLIHTAAEPEVEEWHAYLHGVKTLLATADARVHTVVATDGGGPNAAQRKELADVIEAGAADLLTHVFTTDRLVRGIVTAFRWIARSRALAHAPEDFASVCAEHGLAGDEVAAALSELQRSFVPVRTLQLMLGVAPAPRAAAR